jgi:hypothetical protein
VLFPNSAPGQSTTYTKIADGATFTPDGIGRFTHFTEWPSIDHGQVAFYALTQPQPDEREFSHRGVYLYEAGTGLTTVADETTLIPGTTIPYGPGFGGLASVSDGEVAFLGGGVCLRKRDGELTRVLDWETPIPGGVGNFRSLHSMSLRAGHIAIVGVGSRTPEQEFQWGIYKNVDGLQVVADRATPRPGRDENFGGFDWDLYTSFDGRNVAFAGYGAHWGVYTDVGGYLHAVADETTPVPAASGLFTEFGNAVIDDGVIAFLGKGPDGTSGVYRTSETGLERVADTSTLVPGGTGPFDGFGKIALDNGNIVFEASSADEKLGLYGLFGGQLMCILALGDVLDGKPVAWFNIGPEALSGNQIAVQVVFSTDSEGMYVMTVPEPATSFLLLLTGVLMLMDRRKPH